MTLTVWKFSIPAGSEFSVIMPVSAQVLCVDVQFGDPQMWCLCNPIEERAPRKFLLTGTGHLREDLEGARYIGTFQLQGDALVFHLFEKGGVV